MRAGKRRRPASQVEASGLASPVPDLAVVAVGLEVPDFPRGVFLAPGQHGVDEAADLVDGGCVGAPGIEASHASEESGSPGTTVTAERATLFLRDSAVGTTVEAQLHG